MFNVLDIFSYSYMKYTNEVYKFCLKVIVTCCIKYGYTIFMLD
jgi:hypothetical protein